MQTATIEQVELEIAIQAPPERVWKALVAETTFWWPRDFYTSTNAKGFYIEPKLGGRMFEDWGNEAGVVWYEVFAFDPPRSLDLRGYLAIPYGPAISLLHLGLSPNAEGTLMKLSDTIFGLGKDDAKAKVDGWKQVFGNSLKNYVERN